MSELASERFAAAAPDKRSTIRAIYRAVDAPDWARPNLDALADVLRDLSWLAGGPVALTWEVSGRLDPQDRAAIEGVLYRAVAETAGTEHPLAVSVVG